MGALGSADWLVDAAALRETLDRLHGALGRRAPGDDSAGHHHDVDRVAVSLQFVLRKLTEVDLGRLMSALPRRFGGVDPAGELRDLLGGLRSALRAHVLEVLGPPKVALAHQLLTSSAPDLLRILGREDDENSHSDIVAFLLDPRRAPVVAPAALERLVSYLPEMRAWQAAVGNAVATGAVSVRREYVLSRELDDGGDLSRVDIVVSGPGFFLAIENKVWSREHDAQTSEYWSRVVGLPGLRGGLFVSPSGLAPVSADFRPLSYLALVEALLDGGTRAVIGPTEKIVLASHIKTLARSIIPVEMRAVAELEGGADDGVE